MESDQGTFGRLSGEKFSCYIGELPWRNNKPSLSRVNPGSYLCKIRWSPTFKRHLFHLKGVDGRTYILMHSGNFVGDKLKGWDAHSAGCLIFGRRLGALKNGNGHHQKAVLNSRSTERKFRRATDGKPFILKIVDVPKAKVTRSKQRV
jgi:hypothetical protein